MNLIIGALAAFFTLTALRFLLPFALPDRLALLLFGGIAYGVIRIPWHDLSLTLAVAGGAVLLARLDGVLGANPEPWHVSLPRLRVPRTLTGVRHVPRSGRTLPRL